MHELCLLLFPSDFFQKDQLFIILEFEFGGSDLENSNGTVSSLHHSEGRLMPPLCATVFHSDEACPSVTSVTGRNAGSDNPGAHLKL